MLAYRYDNMTNETYVIKKNNKLLYQKIKLSLVVAYIQGSI